MYGNDSLKPQNQKIFGTFFRNIQIDRELIVKARPGGYYIKV